MIHTLPKVGHDHHERILHEVDRLPGLADALLVQGAVLPPELRDIARFLSGTLVPHLDAAEQTLYPELERMYQNRHSMTPMRREHTEVRRLVEQLDRLLLPIGTAPVAIGVAFLLRRILFRLYAILKIHLAEEEIYVRIVDQGVGPEAAEVLAAAIEHSSVSQG